MRTSIVVALVAITGCTKPSAPPPESAPTSTFGKSSFQKAAGPRHKESDAFFVKWLESHGHTDVVVDDPGVGVGSNATRLRASIYGTNTSDKGTIVEMEFTIMLPDNRQITEFVAGIGDSEAQAINDAQVNFMLTTFHVVYKGFINDADPHIKSASVAINGVNRELITGDILTRGNAGWPKGRFQFDARANSKHAEGFAAVAGSTLAEDCLQSE